MDSQLLSNFKLFSKSAANEISDKSKTSSPIYYISAIVLFAVCIFVYYKQDEIKNLLNSWIGKLWLSTHLTSEGVLSSTFVPAKFSLFSFAKNAQDVSRG